MSHSPPLYPQHLRQVGVVGKFVEFFGPGVAQLSIADRATIANMCPEYGATAAFFPVDHISLQYLEQTGEISTPMHMSSTIFTMFLIPMESNTDITLASFLKIANFQTVFECYTTYLAESFFSFCNGKNLSEYILNVKRG